MVDVASKAAIATVATGLGFVGTAHAWPKTATEDVRNNSNVKVAEATCTTDRVSCIGNGGYVCDVEKFAGSARFHLKWRLMLSDGTNTRFVPFASAASSNDGTGFKNLFITSGAIGTESWLDGFPVGHDADNDFEEVTFYTLGPNEFIDRIQWKLCDDGSEYAGAPICDLQSDLVNYKC